MICTNSSEEGGMANATLAYPEPLKADTQTITVVVETPQGRRGKYKFDQQGHFFRISKLLPAGSVFPYDFGFIPGTKAEDGDPIDVLLLMEEPTFPGCVTEARLIGVIEAEQTEDGAKQPERNDRLVAVATSSIEHRDLHTLREMKPELLKQLEAFFCQLQSARGQAIPHRGDPWPQAGGAVDQKGNAAGQTQRVMPLTELRSDFGPDSFRQWPVSFEARRAAIPQTREVQPPVDHR